jgi:hypothetical protein
MVSEKFPKPVIIPVLLSTHLLYLDFHALLCGTSKPILEQWKNGEADSPNLPWSLKTNQQRNFSDSDLEYLAKIKALTEMSDHIYSVNFRSFLFFYTILG